MAKSQADMVKIGVAVVALLGAGVLLLVNFTTIFDGSAKKSQRTTQQQEEFDEQFKEQERIQKELEESGEIEIGGA